MTSVYIAFSGKADVWWLRFLKSGFRHCFALVQDAGRWIVVDPMLHKTDINVAACESTFDLPQWLRARGYRVIRAPIFMSPPRALMPAPFTCVEAVKRIIGLRAPWVFTPWQLYRHLSKINLLQGEPHGKSVQ